MLPWWHALLQQIIPLMPLIHSWRVLIQDSLCSRDLFYSKSDFVTKVEPTKPFRVQGIGGNIKAISICKFGLDLKYWIMSTMLQKARFASSASLS